MVVQTLVTEEVIQTRASSRSEHTTLKGVKVSADLGPGLVEASLSMWIACCPTALLIKNGRRTEKYKQQSERKSIQFNFK